MEYFSILQGGCPAFNSRCSWHEVIWSNIWLLRILCSSFTWHWHALHLITKKMSCFVFNTQFSVVRRYNSLQLGINHCWSSGAKAWPRILNQLVVYCGSIPQSWSIYFYVDRLLPIQEAKWLNHLIKYLISWGSLFFSNLALMTHHIFTWRTVHVLSLTRDY